MAGSVRGACRPSRSHAKGIDRFQRWTMPNPGEDPLEQHGSDERVGAPARAGLRP